MMDSKELRQKFIKFFETRGHKLVPPASLIPENDTSVLFTSAGMQQFKRFYIHPDEVPAKNIVTCQPCFRTSDIDEVGDETHLTFFEMLGNFSFGYAQDKSFGGYNKEEAIKWGYEFLTKKLAISPSKIWCSIFSGDDKNPRDNESAKILDAMGLKYKEHPREDNFWGPTGNEGPCGPTVEFYINDIEIWNLVFNEYYKNADGTYQKLKTSGVDTGMGLERLAAIVQGKQDVFETDLLASIIKKIEEISGQKYFGNQKNFRIISDHIKAAVFALNDNILPSNKERGYIVRRLIRRAVVKARQIKIEKDFTKIIATDVFKIYNSTYKLDEEKITAELEKEEKKFGTTLKNGLRLLKSKNEITGKDLFDLYQSYGIPMEISVEENIKVNDGAIADFEKLLKVHQEKSRTASAGMFKGGLSSDGEQETKYHSATHLLLASLRQVLGSNVNQKGANITAERIRFDFNYPEKLTNEQIAKIENIVNGNIKKDLPVKMQEMALDDALKSGAMSIPGFEYPDKVKVYSVGHKDDIVSKEICGGPHVAYTSELGHFKIIKEGSSSSGIRRIKAILK